MLLQRKSVFGRICSLRNDLHLPSPPTAPSRGWWFGASVACVAHVDFYETLCWLRSFTTFTVDNVDRYSRYLKTLSIFFNKVQSDLAWCRDLLAFPQLNLQEERLPIFFRVVNAADPVGIPKQSISEICCAVKELVAFGNQLGALKAHHLGMSIARKSLSQPLLKAQHFRVVLPMLAVACVVC